MATRSSNRLPPGPGRLPGLAGLSFIRDRITTTQSLTAKYGDVVAFYIGPQRVAILNHPDFVRDVLVTRSRSFHKGLGLQRAKLLLGEGLLTSEDADHQRQRRLLQPAFHRERIAAYGATMAAYAERQATAWRDGETRNLAREMSRLTLAIAGKTLFDADVEGETEVIGAALGDVLANFNITLLPFGDKLVNLPIPHAVRFRRARSRLDGIVYRLIAQRRATGTAGSDVLSTLVAARDQDDGVGLSDVEVRDQVLTLLLAGHETTANALTWSWYLLSQHPEAADRLVAEVHSVCGDRRPGAEHVSQLAFTRAVIAEAMRLYPPAYLVGRRAMEDYDVPGTDYVLPSGTVVVVSQYLLHRDPRFWDAPDAFRPERWLGDAAPRYAYFPFGAGPRICIGEQFAWMEGVLVLATIARRWRMSLDPRQRIALGPIITLRPKYGMAMQLSARRI
ncbi:MAG TPA: cytochrome P450 [Vicinamibacterales bacterium]|nr:cytochrome P450 [Vicinamibacterales bacterium]